MNKSDLKWVAGLLEGEGCFTFEKQAAYKNGLRYRRASVACNMTDEDVIRRLHELVGEGRVTHLKNKQFSHYKPTWRWRVEGEPAVGLMLKLLPFMFSRRKQRISEVLSVHVSERKRGKEAKRAWAMKLNAARAALPASARKTGPRVPHELVVCSYCRDSFDSRVSAGVNSRLRFCTNAHRVAFIRTNWHEYHGRSAALASGCEVSPIMPICAR